LNVFLVKQRANQSKNWNVFLDWDLLLFGRQEKKIQVLVSDKSMSSLGSKCSKNRTPFCSQKD
jgi:hypothetical protein